VAALTFVMLMMLVMGACAFVVGVLVILFGVILPRIFEARRHFREVLQQQTEELEEARPVQSRIQPGRRNYFRE